MNGTKDYGHHTRFQHWVYSKDRAQWESIGTLAATVTAAALDPDESHQFVFGVPVDWNADSRASALGSRLA
jgi:hypothetical protein